MVKALTKLLLLFPMRTPGIPISGMFANFASLFPGELNIYFLIFLIPQGISKMIPHIPHEELLFLEDPQMDFISQYIHFLSAWGT